MAENKRDEGRGAETKRTEGPAPAPTYTATSTPAITNVEGQVAEGQEPRAKGLRAKDQRDEGLITL